MTSSCLSLSTCKQCATMNWWAPCHRATPPPPPSRFLWAILWKHIVKMSVTAVRLKWKRLWAHFPERARSYKNKTPPKKEPNFIWKSRWVKIGGVSDSPVLQPDSSHQSPALLIHSSPRCEHTHSNRVLAIQQRVRASSHISGPAWRLAGQVMHLWRLYE